ncbi:MAG: hypothetical protein CMJ30_01460 [Phycisphaerae bacterium]|jgi:flagellar biogenesis protein FliO|nr:hypothetical protein [Phycisphaerae bacterium]
MAWINTSSVVVAASLMVGAAQAEEAKANRPVTFVMPAPVVSMAPPVTETTLVASEELPAPDPSAASLPSSEAALPAVDPSVIEIPKSTNERLPAPSASMLPTLPARSAPGAESQTMSLANTALVRLAAATAGVLLLAVLVLSRLPRRVRERASAGPSGVVEILARWPVAKGERLILVKFDRRMLLCHDAGQGWNRLCEVDDLTAVARIAEAIEGKSDRDTFRQTLESVATQGNSGRARRPRPAALVETTSSPTQGSSRPKRGVVVDLTKGRRVRITA